MSKNKRLWQKTKVTCLKQTASNRTVIQLWQFTSLFWLPWWLSGKESACRYLRWGFHPWAGKIPRRRKWQPTPVFLPGKFHGQRSLGGCSLWGPRIGHNWACMNAALYSAFWLKHLLTTYYIQSIVLRNEETAVRVYSWCSPSDWKIHKNQMIRLHKML